MKKQTIETQADATVSDRELGQVNGGLRITLPLMLSPELRARLRELTRSYLHPFSSY